MFVSCCVMQLFVSFSSFAIILRYNAPVTLLFYLPDILLLFLMVLCVGVHCVIVVFPDHTHLIFKDQAITYLKRNKSSISWDKMKTSTWC